jgi:hypothetical protein
MSVVLTISAMTGRQRSKLAMFGAVESLCSQYRHVWGQLPAFRSAFEQYQSDLTALTDLAKIQRRDTGGVSQAKNRKRLDLCELAFEIAAAIRANALAAGDHKAANKLAFSLTELRIGKDTLCIERCRQVLVSARNQQTNLEGFGVTERKLQDLKTFLDDFAATLAETRTVRAANKKVTGQLPALFKKAEATLYNQLDNLMPQFRSAAARFYYQYQEVRILKALNGRAVSTFEPEPEETPMLD